MGMFARRLSVAFGKAGSGVVALRAVSPANYMGHQFTATAVNAGTQTELFRIIPFVIGADVPGLVLSTAQWAVIPNVGISQPGNGFTITKASVQLTSINTTPVPVTFGGNRNITVVDGSNDIQSDELLASAFSLAKFTKGTAGFIRINFTFTTPATDKFADMGARATTTGWIYNFRSDRVSVTKGVDDTGIFTYSMINGGVNGTDAVNGGGCPIVVVLGRHTDSAIGLFGDSKTYGTGDTVTAIGVGGISRVLAPDATLPAGAKPGINFGCPSGIANDCLVAVGSASVSLITSWNKYLTHAIVGYGTNGVSNTAQQSLHTQIRSGGFISKIFQVSCTPRTTALVLISSLTSTGTTATATVADTSGLTTGQSYPIAGATGATTAYNGTYAITVVDSTHFTYTFAGTGGVAATGSPNFSDQWRSSTYQTAVSGWSTGGTIDNFETFLAGLPTTDANMTFYRSLAERQATTGNGYWTWKTNGAVASETADGIHETAAGYEDSYGAAGTVVTQSGTTSATLRSLIQAL